MFQGPLPGLAEWPLLGDLRCCLPPTPPPPSWGAQHLEEGTRSAWVFSPLHCSWSLKHVLFVGL